MPKTKSRPRALAVAVAAVLLATLAPFLHSVPAMAGPVATSDEAYLACGRAFPDPQA